MLYGKDAIAYDKALKSLEQARVAIHYLATHINGAYHNLEQGLYETANAVREVQAALDVEEQEANIRKTCDADKRQYNGRDLTF